MIDAAEREGKIRPGGTLVEATAGNTGRGLALVAIQKGNRVMPVIPDKKNGFAVRSVPLWGPRLKVIAPRSTCTRDTFSG